jgi:hypothetical protein
VNKENIITISIQSYYAHSFFFLFFNSLLHMPFGLRRSARFANRKAGATASSSSNTDDQQVKSKTATVPTLVKDDSSSIPTRGTFNLLAAFEKDGIYSFPSPIKDNNTSLSNLKEDESSSSLQTVKEDDNASVQTRNKDNAFCLSALEKDNNTLSLQALEKDDTSTLPTMTENDTFNLPAVVEKDDISSFPTLKENDASSLPIREKAVASILPILKKYAISSLQTLEKYSIASLPTLRESLPTISSHKQYVITDEVPALINNDTHTKEDQTLISIEEALETLKKRQAALPKVPSTSKSSTVNSFEEMFLRRLIKMGAPALQTSSPLNEEKKVCLGPIYETRKRYARQNKESCLWKDLMVHRVEYEIALMMTELEYLYEEEFEARIQASRLPKGTKRKHWQMMEQEEGMFATNDKSKRI